MDKAYLGGLLALDASPRPLGFLNPLPPPTTFHRTTMEADGTPPGRGRSIEVDFFSDEKDKKTAAAACTNKACRTTDDPGPPAGSAAAASCLAIKKEDLTINVRYYLALIDYIILVSFFFIDR